MTDRLPSASLLANGPFARVDAPYRVLEAAGPDAAEFLHRLCSQDVQGLADGRVAPAAFLDAKGKVQVTCLIARVGAGFVLEVQAEQEERLATLLERYHFTERVAFTRHPDWRCAEVVGEAAAPVREAARAADGGLALRFARRGVAFARAHGPAPASPADGRATRPLPAEHAECLRMLAGLVRVGVETDPTTLALEADLDDHCATDKGCYTGQEVVARIHTYGHTNRALCLLALAAGPAITAPQPLQETEDQLAVGRVMHAVPLPDGDGRLGVGYLPKDFQAIGTRLALADETAVTVVGYEPLAGLPA